jgi:hypothetical protein
VVGLAAMAVVDVAIAIAVAVGHRPFFGVGVATTTGLVTVPMLS